jgi:hypothetical protein
MSLPADVYEPKVMFEILKGLEKKPEAKAAFEHTWKECVRPTTSFFNFAERLT